MSNAEFKNWLKLFTQAWQDKDINRFVDLFSDNSVIVWQPFIKAAKGKEELSILLNEIFSEQDNIKLSYEVLSLTEKTGIVHLWCIYHNVNNNSYVNLDGIYIFELDKNNLCKTLNAWWNIKEVNN